MGSFHELSTTGNFFVNFKAFGTELAIKMPRDIMPSARFWLIAVTSLL